MKKKYFILIVVTLIITTLLIGLAVLNSKQKSNQIKILTEAKLAETSSNSATVTLNKEKAVVAPGSNFTVTLNVKCSDGINALQGIYSYDTSKIELVKNEVVNNSWSLINDNDSNVNEILVICNAENSITDANVIKTTFKLKDTAKISEEIKVSLINIVVDSDKNTVDSTITVENKDTTIYSDDNRPITVSTQSDCKVDATNRLITNVPYKTNVKNFKDNMISTDFTTTKEVTKPAGKELFTTINDNAYIGTGMVISFDASNNYVTRKSDYTLVVPADVNGDGEVTINDIFSTNKYRRKGNQNIYKYNETSEDYIYCLAADIDANEKIDIMDMFAINRIRRQQN